MRCITTIPSYLRASIIAIVIILAACTTQPEVPTPGVTIEVVRNTAVPPTTTTLPTNPATTNPTSTQALATVTATPQPSNTPTTQPTATDPTQPTQTPRPAPTGTATLAAHIDLPDWVNDADTAVLLAHTYEGSNELISFINAATGARVDLDLAHRYGKVQWGADESGLYVEFTKNAGSGSDGLRDRIYIATGTTTRLPLASPEELATSVADSKPQRYTTGISEDDAKTVSITDTELGTITSLADPFNGRRTQSVIPAWSADQSYLVVWRGDWVEEERRNVGDTVIYTPQGAVIATYENSHRPQWSPTDGRLLFYTDVYNQGKLCLTAVDTGTIDCDGLSLWREENKATTSRYIWSPDGRYLSLILHDGCPSCDDRSFAELAIVDIEQDSLTFYGNVFYRGN